MYNLSQECSKVIVTFCQRYKLPLLVFFMLLVFLALKSISQIKSESRLDHWFNHEDQSYKEYSDFIKTFGNDQYFILVYRNDSLISKSGFKKIRTITDSIKKINDVERIVSLHTIRLPVYTPFAVLTRPLLPAGDFDKRMLETKLDKHKNILKNVLSEDRKSTVFHVYQKETAISDSLYAKLNGIVKMSGESDNFFFYSGKVLSIEATKLAKTESKTFILYSMVVMLGILLLIFRSLYYAIIPLLVSLVSIIITLGMFVARGGHIDMLSGIIPLVILVMSSTFSIHLLSKIKHYSFYVKKNTQVLNDSLSEVLIPGVLSNFTTSLAFLSFSFSDIEPIRVFGLYCALGVVTSFIVSLILVIICYSTFSSKFKPQRRKIILNRDQKIESFLESSIIKSPLTFITIIVITMISFYGISELKIETDVFRFFKSEHKVVKDKEIVESWFRGTQPIEVVFSTQSVKSDSLHFFIEKIGILGNRLEENNDVVNCLSLADFQEILKHSKVPNNKIFKLLAASKYIGNYYNEVENRIRLVVNSKFMSNQETLKLKKDIEGIIDDFFNDLPPDYFVTGVSILYTGLNSDILESQLTSIAFSLLIVLLIIVLIFKFSSLSMVGIIPNILPILNTLGIMGLLGVKLDVGTVLVASISLGVSVDDTIYLLYAYKRSSKSNNPMRAALSKVSLPLIRTTIVICLGFLIMTMSNYQPIYYLGIFVAINIVMALFYDFILIPWILVRLRNNSTRFNGKNSSIIKK